MNGVDKEQGKLLVPFDLVSDIIRPLERLEDGIDELKRNFDSHLKYVDEAIKTEMAPIGEWVKSRKSTLEAIAKRRAKVKRGVIWSVSVGGPILLTLIAKLAGAY